MNRAKEAAAAPWAGHKLYWANPCGAIISNPPPPKRVLPGLAFGEKVQFEGKVFVLKPAANGNVALEEAA